ncbi:MAG: sulfite exporter TauE/SafE family protein [Magnetospirillum sp.]|nr:sulfite exporter TauE/SafE family protein [Magnetospirillum sp.]
MSVDTAHLALFALLLLAAGAAAGVVAGLLGVGGGIVVVPVLFHLFTQLGIDEAVRMKLAVGTSLATIVVTAWSSAGAHWKRGTVDRGFLKAWGPALPKGAARVALGGTIGALSAMMGIGGGTLTVPVMTLFGTPVHRAVGTAAAMGFVIGVPGTLAFMATGLGVAGRPPFSLGYVSLAGLALIAPTSMVCAPYGARLAHRLDARPLRRVFAVFPVLTSARMFWQIWG